MLFTLRNGRLSGTVFAAAEEAETGIVSAFEGIRTHKGENVMISGLEGVCQGM